MYELAPMLKIRTMREDRARTDLAGARIKRDAAEHERDERRRKREKFDETKEEKRDKLFDTVMGKPVTRDMLETVRAAVSKVDEEGLLLAKSEQAAESELKKKTEEVEVSRLRFVASAKDLSKIEEHRRAWEEEDRKMREALADAEMEEFTGRKAVADDDDSFD